MKHLKLNMSRTCILFVCIICLAAQNVRSERKVNHIETDSTTILTSTTVTTSTPESNSEDSDDEPPPPKTTSDGKPTRNELAELFGITDDDNSTTKITDGTVSVASRITDGMQNATVSNIEGPKKGELTDKFAALNDKLVELNETLKDANSTVVESTKLAETSKEEKSKGGENSIVESDEDTKSPKTFMERVKDLMHRLFKRDVTKMHEAKGSGYVGSLVRRDSDELINFAKVTVPPICQVEYYNLRQRKEEIERNKNVWRHLKNQTEHEELIQETWEKLVNWSQDHIRFEQKVLQMNRMIQHGKVMKSKDIDSDDDEPDSDDKLLSIDPDEDSAKSLPPEYATQKNLAEETERYKLVHDIADIERKIQKNPKEEDNEKNQLLLRQYRADLMMVKMKYDRIREMKLNREFVEKLWKEKNMIQEKKDKDSDDDEDESKKL